MDTAAAGAKQHLGSLGQELFGLLARASAQGHMLLMDAVADADNDSVPAFKQDSDGTVLSKCSTAALDAWAITYGLPSGTSGIFGRRGAIGSSGGVATPTVTVAATLIPAGSQLTDSTGLITVQTTANMTSDGPPNTQTVSLVSVTTGAQANLPVGSVLTWVAPPANVAATVTLTQALTGGLDRETDGALLTRILYRLQNPPRGGTAADYRVWTESAVDLSQNNRPLNVKRGHIFPLRSGLGAVDVLPLMSGSGTARIPSGADLTALAAYLATVKPVTAAVNVLTASMPAARALRIKVRPTPFPKYAYDWNDAGTSTLITAINVGNKTISCTSPAALSGAFFASAQPRVQIIVSTAGASPKPHVARVTNVALGAPDVLTLDTWPSVDPTPGTDYFYAGSAIVDPVATALLAYVDALGPSNQSGYADEYDSWDWQVSISKIDAIVMTTRDTDGSLMVERIPNIAAAVGTGITIAVGAGAFAATDFSPRDVLGIVEVSYLRAGGIELPQAT